MRRIGTILLLAAATGCFTEYDPAMFDADKSDAADDAAPPEDGAADDDGGETDDEGGGETADDGGDTDGCVPAGPEVCNGLDDDCDGATDEGFDLDADPDNCGTCGVRCGNHATCGGGRCTCTAPWADCNESPDDGCETDTNSDDQYCGNCSTACTGGRHCVGGGCTGAGDPCGVPGAREGCTTTCGSTGERICTGGTWGECVPPDEICGNGIDDDCDGVTDECGVAEICDGIDNDGDTWTDEGFACRPGATRSCRAPCAIAGTTIDGTQECSATCDWSFCSFPAESCNGIDDDCDGLADNGFACVLGATGTCTTTCGSTGTRSCSSSCDWGSCAPPPETCNGIDDDCDGATDEGFNLASDPNNCGACRVVCAYANATPLCVAGACTMGACDRRWIDQDGLAANGCEVWDCTSPEVEVCNGLDDDCDGATDDGPIDVGGPCGTDVGECRTGVLDCSGGTLICSGATGPTEEVCNGYDDDCDTSVDEGLVGDPCGMDEGACVPGVEQCIAGARTCVGEVGPGAEICNGLDDDCDGITDEGC